MTDLFAHIPTDFDRSPYTGWTRQHWLAVAERLIGGYLKTLDTDSWMPNIGDRLPMNPGVTDPRDFGPTETFERHLILAAAWLKGTGITRAESWPHDVAETYREAIILGTTPGSPHDWGIRPDCAAFGNGIAMAIMVAPEYFWDPFTDEQKQHIGQFMKRLAEHSSYDNNHWYFHLAGVPIMDICGIAYDEAYFVEKWERLINWYVGDGWYKDGNNESFDYYNHWGFHYFNLLLYVGCERWREKFGDHIREATTAFLTTYPAFFDSEVRSAPWGRSLMYRHALLAPVVWAEFAGINPLSSGLSRRIASGNMKYFFDSITGSITDDDLLSQGFGESNRNLWECYNDQGSAYWSSTAMICLALPEDHAFWTAKEEPLAVEQDADAYRVTRLEGPKMLIEQREGAACMVPFEQQRSRPVWQLSIKYGQHGYSSRYGFGLVGEHGDDPGFNRLGSRASADEPWRYRQHYRCETLGDDYGVSNWPVYYVGDGEGEEDVSRWYHAVGLNATGQLHTFYHTANEPQYVSFGGVCLSSPDGTSTTIDLFKHTDQCGLQVATHHSAIAQLSEFAGQWEAVTVEPEHTECSSHLYGGTGVFPRWTSVEPIPAHTPLYFVSVATQRDTRISIDEFSNLSKRLESCLAHMSHPIGVSS